MNSYNITSNYNNFDVFSQSTPDLINKKVIKQFKFVFDQAEKQSINNSSTSPSWYDSLGTFYCEYVQANILLIILLIIFILFLIYKYYTKDTTGDDEGYQNIKRNKYLKEQDEINFRPTFNPFYPVKDQTSYVNYLPDERYIEDSKGNLTSYFEQHPDEFVRVNKYQYPYDTNDENDYFSGTYNTYAGAEDPILPNDLGFIDDYNTTTERAVKSMSDANRDNLNLLAEILFENDRQLLEGQM